METRFVGKVAVFDVEPEKLAQLAHLEITDEEVSNDAAGDVLGVNVVSPFLATSHTCSFDTTLTSDAENIIVLTENRQPGGAPVAIHRVVAP